MARYMAVVSMPPILQARHFRKSKVCGTLTNEIREQMKQAHDETFQAGPMQKIKEGIEELQLDLKDSANLILKEQQAVVGLQNAQKLNNYNRCQPVSFIKDYGPAMKYLEETCKSTRKALTQFETGLLLYSKKGDPLLSIVNSLLERHKSASLLLAPDADAFYSYSSRFDIEVSWISQMAKRLEGNYEVFSVIASKIIDLQNNVSELHLILDDLMCIKERANDFELQLGALRTLVMLLEAIGIYSRISSDIKEAVPHVCNMRNLFNEKTRHSIRFSLTEERIRHGSSKMKQLFDDLKQEVDTVRNLYDEKMNCLTKDVQRSVKDNYIFKNLEGISDFSWRYRKYNGRSILPEMRKQGRSQCSYVSTLSSTESLKKRKHSVITTVGGRTYQPDEFIINLSQDHLQDIVTEFFARHKRKSSEKLDVCLERMRVEGVVSEEDYNNAKTIQGCRRYWIKDFQKLNPAGLEEARSKLEEGTVLIANFKITTDYYRLGPDDIYEIPEDAIYETTPDGKICSHCVVIVGYGTTVDGLPFYIFQNSYGPSWGKDGFGRVACSAIKRLYAASVY